MEEQKNLKTLPADQAISSVARKDISMAVSAPIILVAAALIGWGVFYYYQKNLTENSFSSKATVPDKPLEMEKNPVNIAENTVATQAPAPQEADRQGDEEAFDFDRELKNLDDQNNSINPDDFDENELSDANVGL